MIINDDEEGEGEEEDDDVNDSITANLVLSRWLKFDLEESHYYYYTGRDIIKHSISLFGSILALCL